MNTFKIIGLACSGVGAFLAAAEWSRPGADAGDDLVAAAHGPARTASAGSATRGAPPAASLEAPGQLPGRARSIPDTARADAFEPLNWQPPKVAPAPAAPPPPPAPPPAPTAPKLPFTFMGLLERGPLPPQGYVTKGETLLIVAAGDVIDGGTYRVESVDATAVVFTYLPLGTRQTLAAPGVTP